MFHTKVIAEVTVAKIMRDQKMIAAGIDQAKKNIDCISDQDVSAVVQEEQAYQKMIEEKMRSALEWELNEAKSFCIG